MFKKMIWIFALAMLLTGSLDAQDIAGDWQGTLKVGREMRLIVHIGKDENGDWNSTLHSIDQSPDWGSGAQASSVTLQGGTFKLTFDLPKAFYEGKISADGNSIKGTFSQLASLPLDLQRSTKETAWLDPSPHTVQMVTADKNVKLEVLDWGGTGRPVVFLAGLGNTAHIFDKFAPKFVPMYHVYGITRRGFGASSSPASGYSADQLGDDVLAVLDSLKLNRPVLVGHSIAGEELSSVGSRHPEKVAGLIYLDAGYSYAFYDASKGDFRIDSVDLQRKLERLRLQPPDSKQLVQELLQTTLPQLQKELLEMQKDLEVLPPPSASPSLPATTIAVIAGAQKYANIKAPALAIYAVPHDSGPAIGGDAAARAAAQAKDTAVTEAQAKAFELGVPSSRVVRLANANHYVFVSHEADVLKEMQAFLSSLP